jgi:hypothetical protein
MNLYRDFGVVPDRVEPKTLCAVQPVTGRSRTRKHRRGIVVLNRMRQFMSLGVAIFNGRRLRELGNRV